MVRTYEAVAQQDSIALLSPLVIPEIGAQGWHFDRHLPPGLFDAVARKRDKEVFPDGKAIVDSRPRHELGRIFAAYAIAQEQPGFDATSFFIDNFDLPKYEVPSLSEDRPALNLDSYITAMWDVLTYHEPKNVGTFKGSQYPNLKPGERFGEACYWDLKDGIKGVLIEARRDRALGNFEGSASKERLVIGVANNLAEQIDREGYVTNGRRTYYDGRSQVPVFIEIVKDIEAHFGDRLPNVMEEYLPYIVKEYEWWMSGPRAVRLEDKHGRVHTLNRHWDDNDTPRPESYQEDIETAHKARTADKSIVYRHLRAAAESGRDFTARWMSEPNRLETIHTTDFITPELNAYLYKYETEIARAHVKAGRSKLAKEFHAKAAARKEAMDIFNWNEDEGTYFDFDYVSGQQSRIKSMGMAYPPALGASSREQAVRVSEVLKRDMLKAGGFVSTLVESEEQWDGENGWPNDQVMGNMALLVAGDLRTASIASYRWLGLNRRIFRRMGVMIEKSNVVQLTPGNGGEYEKAQRGFLWSNGTDRILEAFLRGQLLT